MVGLDALQQGYQKDIDALRAASDAEFGIFSQRVETPEGETWVRDATQALALDDKKRPSHDALSIEANNTLLRMLTRIRAIDYAISQHPSMRMEEKTRLRNEIKQAFEEDKKVPRYKANILHFANQEVPPKNASKLINEIETEFSTFLITKLHEANLTKGCTTKEHAEALLAHYKVLYSVLDPAMPLVTLTYDEKMRILQRETQYPVTEKTKFQKAYKAELDEVIPYPLDDEVNAHTVHNEAKQQADACFADLLVADDRMLTSQARKTHLMGVKNAFIAKVETQKLPDEITVEQIEDPLGPMDDDKPLWLGRMAVPVYVGKGEKDAGKKNKHIQANLEQLRMAAEKYMQSDQDKLKIHLTTLNTYTNIDGEQQDVMIDGLRRAMSGSKDKVSVIPTNDIGMIYTPELAKSIKQKGKFQPGQKADRLDLAVDVTLEANAQANTISFVNCAGGADRTGTVVEKAIQNHTAKKMGVEASDVETMRARGFNSAEIAHQMVPGTPGMKPCSKANNWFGWGRATFSKQAGREFYLETSLLNKENKVKHANCLKKTSDAAADEYDNAVDALAAVTKVTTETGILLAHKEKGVAILSRARLIQVEAKPQDIKNWTALYKAVTGVINELETHGMSEAYLKELERIDKMCGVFSKQAKEQELMDNFLVTAVMGIATVILLTVPLFNSIFLVAGLVLAATSLKVTSSLKLFAGLSQQVSSTLMGGLNDTPEHGVIEVTRDFAKGGQGFFKAEKDKPSGSKDGLEPKNKGGFEPDAH